MGYCLRPKAEFIRTIHDAHPTGKPSACSKLLPTVLSAAPLNLGLILGIRRATICGMFLLGALRGMLLFLLGALGVCVKEMKARPGDRCMDATY